MHTAPKLRAETNTALQSPEFECLTGSRWWRVAYGGHLDLSTTWLDIEQPRAPTANYLNYLARLERFELPTPLVRSRHHDQSSSYISTP